jgi:hypothetical protein
VSVEEVGDNREGVLLASPVTVIGRDNNESNANRSGA